MFIFDLPKIWIFIAVAISYKMVIAETISGYYRKVSFNDLTPFLSWGQLSVRYSFHNFPELSRRLECADACNTDFRCFFFVAKSEACFMYGYSSVIREEMIDTDDSDTIFIKQCKCFRINT